MNIEPDRVVFGYEQNLRRGDPINIYGVIKLLDGFLSEDKQPKDVKNRELRDRLYKILAAGEIRLYPGQNYYFDDKRPRDDLYEITEKEVDLTEERVELIRKALRALSTSEKNSEKAIEKLKSHVGKLTSKIGAEK